MVLTSDVRGDETLSGTDYGCDDVADSMPTGSAAVVFVKGVGISSAPAGFCLTMDEQRADSKTSQGDTVELWTELPEGVAGWVSDAAARFHVSRSEIIRRAVEHFLGHIEEVKVIIERRERESDTTLDWGHAKKTLEHAHCPYDNCPFAGNCPVDVCPL